MSNIIFSLGAVNIEIASSIIYPVSSPIDNGQMGQRLASGISRIETVGAIVIQQFPLVWDKITSDDIANIYSWFENTVNWGATPFTYHDYEGNTHNVRWQTPQLWDPKLIGYNLYSLQINLESEP